jgi:hypothetical protein
MTTQAETRTHMNWQYIRQLASDFAAAHSTAIAAFFVGVVLGLLI